MKNYSLGFLFLPVFILVLGCSSTKRTQKYVDQGKYDEALSLAVKKLEKNKNSRDSDSHIRTLEETYIMATAEDLQLIENAQRKMNSSPNRIDARSIYYTYRKMIERQDKIRRLLPLHYRSDGRQAVFNFDDYTHSFLGAKNTFAEHLYSEAVALTDRNNKFAYRDAFELLDELTAVYPGYNNAEQLKTDAYYWGTDFVLVSLNNFSGILMPRRLEEELLNFEAYQLNEFWTEYHNAAMGGVQYAYAVDLDFGAIQISPEYLREEKSTRKKEIKSGSRQMKDRQGNVVLDSLGKPVYIDTFKEVTAEITTITQEKKVSVSGMVVYRDLTNNRRMTSFPLASEFIFVNRFAEYTGEQDALNREDLDLIRNRFVPFPSNEQMVYDAGTDLKEQLKSILKRYPLTR